MNSTLRSTVAGAVAGGVTMYLLDPDRGARRRALVRDKTTRAVRVTRETVDAKQRHVRNKLAGVQARTRKLFGDGAANVTSPSAASVRGGWSPSRVAAIAAGAGVLAMAAVAMRNGRSAEDNSAAADDARTFSDDAPVGFVIVETISATPASTASPVFGADEPF
jgi:hypothetical protein